MLRPAAHEDLIVAALDPEQLVLRQALPERLIRVERGAFLIEDRQLQIGAEPDPALIRRELGR